MKFVLTFECTGGMGLDTKRYPIYPLADQVSEAIEQKSYGTGLGLFHVVLQLLVPEQAKDFPEGQFYRPRKKEAVVAKLLDVEQVMLMDEPTWRRTVFETVLELVFRCRDMNIKGFDYQAFHDDLRAYFLGKGWI